MTAEGNTTHDLRCIWCGQPSGPEQPPEHIVPEAIGCPEDLVLTQGEVCGDCNNKLAHLDQALIDDLEIYAFMAGVPRKKGPPAIHSHGNLRADVKNGHAATYINMDRAPTVMPDGRRLAGFKGQPRDIAATFTREGMTGTVEFDVRFGKSPKVARALVKMAAEYFCFTMGRDEAARLIVGAVADFVRFGKGDKPIILGAPDPSKYQHVFGSVGREGGDWFCGFRLAHFEVVVDLGPGRRVFDVMAPRLHKNLGRTGWTTLPPEAFVG
jgi:hypothetical protein